MTWLHQAEQQKSHTVSYTLGIRSNSTGDRYFVFQCYITNPGDGNVPPLSFSLVNAGSDDATSLY